MTENAFLEELRRRQVIKAAAIYVAVAWGVTEIVVTVVTQLFLPGWVSTLAVIVFVVGFPIAMFLAWIFDITPDGIQRTSVTSRRGKFSIAGAVILLVVLTSGLFLLIKPSLQENLTEEIAVAQVQNRIAVLPFDNASRNADDQYLVGGLGDELRDQLGRVSGLRIAARSSSIAARERSPDAKSRSESLGVDFLVEGNIRRRNESLIVSVQLIEGNTGLSVWQGTYDRSARELLSVQQIVAEEIVNFVLPEFSDVAATQLTRSETANELMLLARYYEGLVQAKRTVDEPILRKAIGLYRQATDADPYSALAFARLANAQMYLGDFASAEAPIFRALSLNPNLSEVQNTLGSFYWARGEEGAGTAYKRAVDLNPNNADALSNYAYWLWIQGSGLDAGPLYERALALDPLSLLRFGALGEYYAQNGLVADALAIAQRIDTTFDGVPAIRLIARLMELTGRVDRSIAWTIRARNLEPENIEHHDHLAELYAELGDEETAMQLAPDPGVGLLYKLRRYEELIDIGEFLMIDEPNDLDLRYLLAFAYLATDKAEAAVRVLQSTGLPNTVFGEARQASDLEGFMTLVQALAAIGEIDTAIELANWWIDRPHVMNSNWWIKVHIACPLAIKGNDDEALNLMASISQSARLPWATLVHDSYCFRDYKENDQYKEMLSIIDRRRKDQLDRLPATLAELNVSL